MHTTPDNTPESLNHAEELVLTPQERAAGRMALEARMALSLTPEEKTDIRRALQRVVYAEPAPAFSWGTVVASFRLPSMALAAFLLLAASGGGIAYAAERSLPGDALYGVKIHVNEAIRATFVSPSERAQWALIRLERRIDELKRLEARGSASEEIDVAIGDSLEEVAGEVETEVGALPAAAAERAALRTAVNAAIGTDQDSLRRASRINRVLKALKDRAESFDEPAHAEIKPVPPAVRAGASAAASVGPLRVNAGASASFRDTDSDDDARAAPSRSSATSSVRSAASSDAAAPSSAALPLDLDLPGAVVVPDAEVPTAEIDLEADGSGEAAL